MATLKTISLLRSDLASSWGTHNTTDQRLTALHSILFAEELMGSNHYQTFYFPLLLTYPCFNEDLPKCYALFDVALNKLFTL